MGYIKACCSFRGVINTKVYSRNKMTVFAEALYKNWYDSHYLKKNVGYTLAATANKIKKMDTNNPAIAVEIADFVFEVLKFVVCSDADIKEHIEEAIFNINKGNTQEDLIFVMVKDKVTVCIPVTLK